jgi:hypothetical protein
MNFLLHQVLFYSFPPLNPLYKMIALGFFEQAYSSSIPRYATFFWLNMSKAVLFETASLMIPLDINVYVLTSPNNFIQKIK